MGVWIDGDRPPFFHATINFQTAARDARCYSEGGGWGGGREGGASKQSEEEEEEERATRRVSPRVRCTGGKYILLSLAKQ